MMANFLPANPLLEAISAIANGKVCIVTTMINLPDINSFASSPDFEV